MAVLAVLGVAFCACEKDDKGTNDYSDTGGTLGDWVDLGLPSGLLWATHNVGADGPEDYGHYFAWGETQTKGVYDWETYTFCDGGHDQLTKYCSDSTYGYNDFTDGLTTLQASDDAATAALGNGARIPTSDEWQELMDNCTMAWGTQNGVSGCRFTGRNGKVLFLPVAGSRWDGGVYFAGERGTYWSSSLNAGDPSHAWGFYFDSTDAYKYADQRFYGLSIRPVRSAH